MRKRVLAVLALACGVSASLFASVGVPADFQEIVGRATLIVRGRVTDVRAENVAGRGVETVATVAVENALKGEASTFVSVRVPGGTMGRYRVVMIGAPTLRVDERAVFFLIRGSDSAWRPVGLSSGIVTVEREPATGRAVVHPPLIVGRTAAAGPVVRGDVRRKSLAVEEFESLVRLVMAGRLNTAIPR